MKDFLLIFLLLPGCVLPALAQHAARPVEGVVRDSATLEPLPYVYITCKNQVTVSDEQGKFTLRCEPADTLSFSRVGYKTKKLLALTQAPLLVNLSETVYQLKPVTIYGGYKPTGHNLWSEHIVLPSKFRNPTLENNDHLIQTIGPGYVFTGVFSRFLKSKEERQLQKVKEEHSKTRVYRSLIASEKLKLEMMQRFLISEETFYKKLEKFNTTFPDAAYAQTQHEILDLLMYFFSLKD